MAGDAFVIFAGDEVWRLRSPGASDELRFERGAAAATIAPTVAAKLRERGYQGQGVLLALPATWCLSAVVSTADLPRQDRAALSFRLEEKLPLAAENFTADFADLPGGRALGVCAPNERLVPLVEALERGGIVVQSVTPAVMLAVQGWVDAHARPASGPAKRGDSAVVVWREESDINLVTLLGSRPASWAVVPADRDALGMQLDVAAMEMPEDATVVACDLADDEARWLRERDVAVTSRPDSIEDAVVRVASGVLAGAVTPWVELRRGALAVDDPLRVVRRPINAVLAAAAILCVVLAGVFLYRSFRYDRLAQSYEQQLAEDFRREFPGWPVPPNPRRMIESERAKLTGGGAGVASSSLPPEAQESALRVLHDVLSKIPPESKMAITRLVLNDTSLELEARSRAYEDADVLVAAARAAGMDVPPPQMRKLVEANAWSFVVRGSKPVKSTPAGAAAAAAGGQE